MPATQTYALRCEICGQDAKAADSAIQAARNLGLHKRSAHGIPGKTHNRYRRELRLGQRGERERRRYGLVKTARAEQLAEARRIRWAKYKQDQRAREKAPAPAQNTVPHSVEAAKLDACPVCGARFYVAKGQP